MLLRGSVILGISLFVVELISQEPKTTGHAELTCIHQGPLLKQTGLKAIFQQADLRIIRALEICCIRSRPLTDGSLGGQKVVLVPVNSKLISPTFMQGADQS